MLCCLNPNCQNPVNPGDRTIKLWNTISGAELATFKGHTSSSLAVAFSPDGRKLVSTSEDKAVKVWRVPQ